MDHETDAARGSLGNAVGTGSGHRPGAVGKHDNADPASRDSNGIRVHGPIIVARGHCGAGVGRDGVIGSKHRVNASLARNMSRAGVLRVADRVEADGAPYIHRAKKCRHNPRLPI